MVVFGISSGSSGAILGDLGILEEFQGILSHVHVGHSAGHYELKLGVCSHFWIHFGAMWGLRWGHVVSCVVQFWKWFFKDLGPSQYFKCVDRKAKVVGKMAFGIECGSFLGPKTDAEMERH